jgi:signal transduction histidine kinase
MAILTVEDTGPGIPPAFRDDIFKPFHSTKEEGTGLGLSIANRIMAEHGGWLHLKSTGPMGTTFVLALPLKESSSWLRS